MTSELYILQTWFVTIAGAKVVRIIESLLGFNLFAVKPILLTAVFGPVISVCALVFMFYVQKIIKKLPFIGEYVFRLPIAKIL